MHYICKGRSEAWNRNATTSKLEVVGNLWHRYDNSSPRYSVRTTMPSLVPSPKFPTFPTYKISIPLLLFSRMFRREFPQSSSKIRGFSNNPLSSISLFALEMEFKHILYVPASYFYSAYYYFREEVRACLNFPISQFYQLYFELVSGLFSRFYSSDSPLSSS